MTAPQDQPDESSETINLSHSFAREYWRTRLNTNIADLKEAVQSVGPKLHDVKRFLMERAKQRREVSEGAKPRPEGGPAEDSTSLPE